MFSPPSCGEDIEVLEHHAHLLTVQVDVDTLCGDVLAFKKDFPLSGISSRFRQRRKVLLPPPDGPMMETTSPLEMCSLTPLSTWSSPKLLCKSKRRSVIGLVTCF